jgi:uncharacterized membrane protein
VGFSSNRLDEERTHAMSDLLQRKSETAEKETGRIEAFSDGVFAIAITLLVLDIRVPPAHETHDLLDALGDRWPNLLAFFASFLFILVMWINHHRVFTLIRRTDNTLLIFNGLLLMGISLVPFTTALVAEYLRHDEETIAVMIYNGWYIFVAIFFNLVWRYASHNNRLFTEKTDRKIAANLTREYAIGPISYLVATLVALIHPYLGLAVNVALAVLYALPGTQMRQLMESEE